MLHDTIINRRLIEDLAFARAQVEIACVRDMLDRLEAAWRTNGVDMDETHPEYGRFVNAVADLTEIDAMRIDEDLFEDQAHWVRTAEEEKHKKAIQTAQDAVKARYFAKYPSLSEAA